MNEDGRGLRVFTLFILALQASEEHCLTLVSRPQLNCSITHEIMTTLGALPLNNWTISLIVFLVFLRSARVLKFIELNSVSNHLLMEELAGDGVLAHDAHHVTACCEAGQQGSTRGAEIYLR